MTRVSAMCVAAVLFAGAARAEAPFERGSYLVNTIMTCGNCHSPKGPPDAVAMTQGIDKDGNRLKGPMGFGYYAHMTDADLDAVIAWVRTLSPKE